MALQETGGTWCISSVLARHGCDLGQSMAVTSQRGQGLYLAQVSSQTLTAHGSVLLLCSKCPAKPRDLPSAAHAKPHEQAAACTSPSTGESNRTRIQQAGKTKIIPSLQDNPSLSYSSTVQWS